MLGLFGKKPQNPQEETSEPVTMNRLQELTGSDTEMYQTLSQTLFLEPKRITIPLETVLSQASEFESKGDRIRAEVWYRIAGGISLYRADIAGVRKYFDKAASITGDSRVNYKTLSRRAEDAVNIAGKFYGNM
jgi:hypothetical protein